MSGDFDDFTSKIAGYGTDLSSDVNKLWNGNSSSPPSASPPSASPPSASPPSASPHASSNVQPLGPGGEAPIPHSKIPVGQEDQYILKSQIVPPVCPACPPQLSCPSKAKCPACPAPNPVQPCPPCARCPESPFTCKKVPDYTSPSIGGVLPRPMLNDFSQF